MAIMFGAATLQISATAGVQAIGRLQNVTLNCTYETAILRGGVDIFGADLQTFNGAIDGSFDHGSIELSQVGRLLFGSGSFAGAAGSGTVTVTGNARPQSFQLVFSGVTNGITATWKLQKVFIPSLTLDFGRTDYTIPSMTFVAIMTGSAVATFQQ